LSDADVRRVIEVARQIDKEKGWGGDLERMIVTLAATGARMSQVARCRVADLQIERKRLMVPASRKGSPEKPRIPVAIPLGDDVIEVLKPATIGRRSGTDLLLLRPKWRRVPGPGLGVLEVYQRGPWKAASELSRAWLAIRDRAGLPNEDEGEGKYVAYCLRHNSIIRALRTLPVELVARLHDTSSKMISDHYAAYIGDAFEQLSRDALVPMISAPITPLRVVKEG
jgi:integrase